jgi:hypothetical protein
MIRALIIVVLLFSLGPSSIGQVYHPNGFEVSKNHFQYLKNPESNYLNRFIQYEEFDTGSVSIIHPEIGVFFNSSRPHSLYDGVLWSGRGLTLATSFGISGKKGKLAYALFPRLFYSQNKPFDLSPKLKSNKSEYNYQYNIHGDIDYVIRYGHQPFTVFNLGQSEVRYLGQFFTGAISSSNFKLGPALSHSILMSSQAEGIPRVELGTNQFIPFQLFERDLGSIKIENSHGLLRESGYFDSLSDNNRRYFSSFELSYIPPFFPELKIGAHRIFYVDAKKFQPKDLFRSFWYFTKRDNVIAIGGDTTNDHFDQMAALYAELNLKQSGTRIYSQIVLNDFNFKPRSLLTNTFHSSGYTLGFEKIFEFEGGDLLINYETSDIAINPGRYEPSYYIHYQVVQGYTQNGQLIGLGTGPGSNIHTLNLKYLTKKYLMNVSIHRSQPDLDFFYLTILNISPDVVKTRQSPQYILSFDYSMFFEKMTTTISAAPSYEFNRYLIEKNDSPNLFASLQIKYYLN